MQAVPDSGVGSTACDVRERRLRLAGRERAEISAAGFRATYWLGGYPDAMPEMPHTLTAALHREEDWFIAQCLEVDVASQGHTIDEALAGLAEAVELYLEEVDDPAGHVTATPLVTSFQLPAA